jgi:hypothetical protein
LQTIPTSVQKFFGKKMLSFAHPPREIVSKIRYQLLLLSGFAARISAFHGAPPLLLASGLGRADAKGDASVDSIG